MQTNPQEQLINTEHDTTITINQTNKPKWPTILLCVILVITGKSFTKLLETFYIHHNNNQSLNHELWTQPLVRFIGFPLLILPFFLLKKHKQLLITSDRTKSLLVLYLCSGLIMVVQVRLYTKSKLETPSSRFFLLEGTQLYFTMIFTRIITKIKLCQWIFISPIFTFTITIITTTFSSYIDGEWLALLASFTFSFLLCNIHFISKHNNNLKPNFANVLELLIFSSFFATFISFFISGENLDLKKEIEGFLKGKIIYVMTMFGQAMSWQIYWVGLIGLVMFEESIMISNVVSLSSDPIVTSLKILLCNYDEDEFDIYLGGALALHAIALVFCFHKHIKILRGFGDWKPPRILTFVVLFVVYYIYISALLSSDQYISPPNGFELF